MNKLQQRVATCNFLFILIRPVSQSHQYPSARSDEELYDDEDVEFSYYDDDDEADYKNQG